MALGVWRRCGRHDAFVQRSFAAFVTAQTVRSHGKFTLYDVATHVVGASRGN
jgi:hypothetical protein